MSTCVEESFLDKTCPLLNKKCIQEECVAFSKSNQTHYSSCGSKELEIKVPYKDDKRDKFLSYTIFEAIIDKKIIDKYFQCLQYKMLSKVEEVENLNIEYCQHGKQVNISTYCGVWLELRNHNKDIKTADPTKGIWEDKHGVNI